ncbi:MAG: hybrid sensor histidine kinase/response regulator, partial [Sphingomonadales bacterium]
MVDKRDSLIERDDANRLGAEQMSALFAQLPVGVLGAAVAASILAFALVRLGVLDWFVCLCWALYIAACAVLHLLLFAAYRRRRTTDAQWQRWALPFTLIALLEGIGWGLMPVFTASTGNFEVAMLALVVTLGIAAGSIPAFSPWLPAFAAFFLPATVPYLLHTLTVSTPLQQATATLLLLFIIAIFALGVISSRSFRQMVKLRIETAAMAEDLRRQKEIAEAANISKSTFLAAASHDLRQPVHALGLFVGALRGIPMTAEGQRIVAQIEASANAMDGLFAALLDISRLDAGTVEIRPRGFAVAPFLDRICRDHAVEA